MEVAEYGDFLKWWYPTTIGFPTKNDHFGVFCGYHHLRKHPYVHRNTSLTFCKLPIDPSVIFVVSSLGVAEGPNWTLRRKCQTATEMVSAASLYPKFSRNSSHGMGPTTFRKNHVWGTQAHFLFNLNLICFGNLSHKLGSHQKVLNLYLPRFHFPLSTRLI